MLSFSVFSQFRNFKIIYRRYAGLYFCICVDVTDNNLAYLEGIHNFVEVTDTSSRVCWFIYHIKNISAVDLTVSGATVHMVNVRYICCLVFHKQQNHYYPEPSRLKVIWWDVWLWGDQCEQSEFSLSSYLLNLVLYMAAWPKSNIKSIHCIFMFMSPIAYSQQDVIVRVLVLPQRTVNKGSLILPLKMTSCGNWWDRNHISLNLPVSLLNADAIHISVSSK